jgi:hypothetical protein
VTVVLELGVDPSFSLAPIQDFFERGDTLASELRPEPAPDD